MTTHPLVSVIMPIYNTPAVYLREAVRSLLAQTYENWELLAIDDCSTNGAAEVVNEFEDSRIKLIRLEKNGGAAAARNRGMRDAAGEFIAMLDADDKARPKRFATQVKYLQKHPEIDVVGSWCEMFPCRKILECPTSNAQITYSLLFNYNPLANSSIMLRRRLLSEELFAYPEGRAAEDYGAWIKLAGKIKFAGIAKTLVDYRWHGENLSHTQHAAQVRSSTEFMVERWLEMCQMNGSRYRSLLVDFAAREELSDSDLAEVGAFIEMFYHKLADNPQINYSLARRALQKLIMRIIRKAAPEYRARLLAAEIDKSAGLAKWTMLRLKMRIISADVSRRLGRRQPPLL